MHSYYYDVNHFFEIYEKTHGFLVNAFHPKIAASVIYRDRPQVRGDHHPELLKTATHMVPLAGILY